ncbi:protocatechuate 3,4-dioxygenase [Pyxidicoccus fallax]|uniref:Protocatechuate 3,4-dioxygenase n=1 Tax=Pyxidicoccus fallax TaxID=394095 RepID=A0A848LLX7_9BACT|nr:protocatechuate 3,4-dioxygenase [Pyxidicoccus fallax]NMO18699.1 protocatechuate 3,4-dioxygenase [Pyxidicoccus fallax]NPC83943.1 protocatechuate 3,4-dioxygenase [Pyxidicoccus fallax]
MSSDAKSTPTPEVMTRRRVLRGMGLTLAALPLARFALACGEGTEAPAPGGDDAGTGTDAGTGNDAGSGSWATGGTAAMTAAASYPDPFASGIGTVCALTCEATLGPCYADTIERKDISEGHDGLPVRMVLLVVDESCKPIPGASVDIWHAAPEGLYSGGDASDFCTSGDATARAARWFRGVQTTDANGRVEFDTCFPGWYSSRTIHIHFTIRVNGNEYVTSQLFFDDALDDEIVNTQPLYNTRGPRDTTNSNDTVISADSVADYVFQTERMPDGAMLAWKTLVIRSSLDSAQCAVPGGSGGPGGPGGPPPGMDGGMGPPPGWDGGMPPPRP